MPRDDPPISTLPAAAASAAAPLLRHGPGPAQDEAGAAAALLNPRHEAFCQHFVLLANASYAAIDAGYARPSARNQGYRLMRRPAIRARIAEIRRSLARAYCLDAEVLLGKLEAVYQRANERHNFHAAARCVELQARIAGHVSSPKETGSATTNDDIAAPVPGGNRSESTGSGSGAARK